MIKLSKYKKYLAESKAANRKFTDN